MCGRPCGPAGAGAAGGAARGSGTSRGRAQSGSRPEREARAPPRPRSAQHRPGSRDPPSPTPTWRRGVTPGDDGGAFVTHGRRAAASPSAIARGAVTSDAGAGLGRARPEQRRARRPRPRGEPPSARGRRSGPARGDRRDAAHTPALRVPTLTSPAPPLSRHDFRASRPPSWLCGSAAAGWAPRSWSVWTVRPRCRRRRCGWRWCARATRTGAWRRTTSSGTAGLGPAPRPRRTPALGRPCGPCPPALCWAAAAAVPGSPPRESHGAGLPAVRACWLPGRAQRGVDQARSAPTCA